LEYQSHFETLSPRLALARSWVFAAILTPPAIFNATLVQTKFLSLAPTRAAVDELLIQALKMLQEEKLIQRRTRYNKALFNSAALQVWEPAGRLYERFLERRMITPDMLRQAAAYKTSVLDPAFATGGTVRVEKNSIMSDGSMVAVLNLLANGRVKFKPGPDVPITRYGIDHERVGYETRKIDKKLLNFSVDVVPTEAYVSGDVGSQHRELAIPRGDADDGMEMGMGMIPPWVDIHGNLQPGLWEMFVVGVLGLVVQMPGVQAKEISRTLGNALNERDVELLMGWCVDAGFARMDAWSRGYETREWWWLCIGVGGQGEGGVVWR
jgi:hypothetical protein